MADESPVSPISAAEPPKANPLKPATATASTLKLNPAIRRPAAPGATQSALRPTLKLPPKPGLPGGLKLPPKPGAPAAGVKLPTKPALPAGIKLPPKPVIRKPGSAVTSTTLPPPIKRAEEPAAAAPVAPAAETKAPEAKAVTVDAGGVVKLPTVEMKTVDRDDVKPAPVEAPKPIEALKSVTQKLKGITQQIPQQAILRKTGIIADSAMSDAQKQAAKSKTARISLSEAIGAAPVKNENAPMKTIRIKRPVGIETPAAAEPAAPAQPAAGEDAATAQKSEPQASVTQRKTLKIVRPGAGAVRPGGKFAAKRPTAVAAKPAVAAADPAAAGDDTSIPDVADIPEMPSVAALPPVDDVKPAADGPAWLFSLSALVQAAASVAIGALAWFLFENTQTVYF